MKTSRNFILVDKNLIKEFKGEYNLLIQLYLYIEAYNMYDSAGKLQNDGTFYVSDAVTAERLGFSQKTAWKNKKELEKRGFIATSIKEAGGASYIQINIQKIEAIQTAQDNLLRLDDITNSITSQSTQPQEEKQDAPLVIIEAPAPVTPSEPKYEDRIKEAWNTVAERNGLPKILILKEERIKKFKAVIKYLNMTEKEFFNCINSALRESKFLRGYGQKWRADFDFFLSKQKALKTIEGGYKDNSNELLEKLSDVQTMSYKECADFREKMLTEKYRELDKKRRESKQEVRSLPLQND